MGREIDPTCSESLFTLLQQHHSQAQRRLTQQQGAQESSIPPKSAMKGIMAVTSTASVCASIGGLNLVQHCTTTQEGEGMPPHRRFPGQVS
jgi:hypothetical protein